MSGRDWVLNPQIAATSWETENALSPTVEIQKLRLRQLEFTYVLV